jgi:hypothetical protein
MKELGHFGATSAKPLMCRPSFCPLTYGPDRQVAPSSLNQPDHYKETVSSKLQALGKKNKQQKRGRDNLH